MTIIHQTEGSVFVRSCESIYRRDSDGKWKRLDDKEWKEAPRALEVEFQKIYR